jgi:RNA polymerase sigma-70 factor (family 1)
MTVEEWISIKSELKTDRTSAFERLYTRLWSQLYAVAFNYVRDKATAQEIVQEVFVKLWIKCEELQTVNDIHAFALRTIQFRIYDHFDKKSVEERYAQNAIRNSVVALDNAHHQVEYEETFELINKEIDSLPDTTKKVFRFSRFEQRSNEEIAAKLKVSVKTVEYHITQSLKHLRLKLGNILSLIAAVGWWIT